MTYKSCRKVLLLSLAVCLTAPATCSFVWAEQASADKNAPAEQPAAASDAAGAKKASEEKPASTESPKDKAESKRSRSRLSDYQLRHAKDDGYYSSTGAGFTDYQQKHKDDGYYADVKPYAPPPPEAKPVAPPPPVEPVPAAVVAPRPPQPGDRKFEDDPGATGSVQATRHAKQAKELFSTGHYDLAKRHFHESLNIVDNQPDLYPSYWESCAKTNDWGEARRALEKFFQLDPSKKPEFAWAYGQTWYELRNYEKAGPALHEALKYGKKQDEIHEMLLKMALQTRNNQEIPVEFNALLKLKPNDFKNHLDYANWLEVQGRHSDAIGHYRTAVNLQPTDGALAARLAYMLMFYNKDYKGAVTYYRIAMSADPANAMKYNENIKYAEAQMKASNPQKRQQQ